jgi:hypothetical protein
MLRLLIACVVSLAPCLSFGQELSSLNGDWVAKFSATNGLPREVLITFKDGAGTYQLLAKNRDDPCIGKVFPTKVDNFSDEGFDFMVLASQAIPGCTNFAWRAVKREGGGYEGVFSDGRKYLLLRR